MRAKNHHKLVDLIKSKKLSNALVLNQSFMRAVVDFLGGNWFVISGVNITLIIFEWHKEPMLVKNTLVFLMRL